MVLALPLCCSGIMICDGFSCDHRMECEKQLSSTLLSHLPPDGFCIAKYISFAVHLVVKQ
jgi:hypothetical protein